MANGEEEDDNEDSSAVLLEQEVRTQAAKDSDKDPEYADESDVDISEEDLEDMDSETILDSASDLFAVEQGQRTRQVRQERTKAQRQQQVESDAGVTVGSIEESISNLSSLVEDVSDEDLTDVGQETLLETANQRLELISQLLLGQTQLIKVLTSAQVTNISTLAQIKEDLEPHGRISVSGVNITGSEDVAELVVPESDSGNIQTRKIYLRASRSNSSPIAIGDDKVDPNTGFVLNSGEGISLWMDLALTDLYMSSEETGQAIEILALA